MSTFPTKQQKKKEKEIFHLLKSCRVFPDEKKTKQQENKTKKNTLRTIHSSVHQESQINMKNAAMSRNDYKISYDMVPQSYLTEY